MIAVTSLSTAEQRLSVLFNDLDMKATGFPRWFRTAAIATLEASHSTTKGSSSSIRPKQESESSLFRFSNAFTASEGRGNLAPLSVRGLIFVETAQIHLAY